MRRTKSVKVDQGEGRVGKGNKTKTENKMNNHSRLSTIHFACLSLSFSLEETLLHVKM